MIGAALVLMVALCCQAQRPIWNIGHMVNNKYQIDEFLDLGANAVETDIKFGVDGAALYNSHGFPCDCGRDCLRWDYVGEYLEYVNALTSPESPSFRPTFILLSLDLKLKGLEGNTKERALADLARKLAWHLWKNGTSHNRIYVVVHLPTTAGIRGINGFYDQLRAGGAGRMAQRIGWEVYSDEPVEKISKLLVSLNATTNNWQGDGITNCLPRSSRRLQDAVDVRENPNNHLVSKVYYWTVDRMSTMRMVLSMGIDGMMTNFPNRLVEVLKEPGFRGRARLATIHDNPFLRYQPPMARFRQKKIVTPTMLFNREDSDDKVRKTF